MIKLKTLDDIEIGGKKVLVRVDLNVPMKNGEVSSDTRLLQSIPTITEILEKGAGVVLASHMGRPKGQRVPDLSLYPVAKLLRTYLPGVNIKFAPDVIGSKVKSAADALAPGQILFLENLRFELGEEANDPKMAANLAALADIYVGDAFSCAHRAHASVQAITQFLPSVAGRLMEKETGVLSQALDDPKMPLGAVIGGSKISSKLGTLENLVTKVQYLFVGGAMANTFLIAQGRNVGTSLCEAQMTKVVNDILVEASNYGCEVIVPKDVVVAEVLEPNIETETVTVDQVPKGKMILDVGNLSVTELGKIFEACRTILWNGPLGAFEVPPFEAGTTAAARKVAALTCGGKLISIAGGGDTIAALEQAGVAGDFSYISMAGGAFLEWLEGRILPGVEALREN